MRITVIGGAGKMACIGVQYLAQDHRSLSIGDPWNMKQLLVQEVR